MMSEQAVMRYAENQTKHLHMLFFKGHLHDKYGQLVAIYSSLLINKMNFHAKVKGGSVFLLFHNKN